MFTNVIVQLIKILFSKQTTPTHVLALLSKLCKSKTPGLKLDNISAKLLRECPDLLAESLTHIFNQSLMTGIFPDEWKSARVTLTLSALIRRIIDQLISVIPVVKGGAVVPWLVRSTPERALRVRALAWDIALCP